jgi:hypothetical protein
LVDPADQQRSRSDDKHRLYHAEDQAGSAHSTSASNVASVRKLYSR